MNKKVGNPTYRQRVVDKQLNSLLQAVGAVAIEGPRACGKTTTARELAKSEVLLDVDSEARLAAQIEPSLVLEGKTPRLIDEWQLVPEIWNHVRRSVDQRRKPGQFILTGSAEPSQDVTRHTGAGRLSRLRMRPMSLFESLHSSGTISLLNLFEEVGQTCADPGLTVPDLALLATLGGWPGFLDLAANAGISAVKDYLYEVQLVDIRTIDGSRRNPSRVAQLLRSLARNVSTYVFASTLASDLGGGEKPLDNSTVRTYLDSLERLMIIEDQPAWSPNIRSRSVLRSGSRHHFVDPTLAVAALRATPNLLLKVLKLFGLIFESLVVRDLRVYAQAMDAQILQYRDNTGLEVDIIVEAADGRWGAFEVKLGTTFIDEGAKNLLRFRNRIDTSKCGEPSFLGVIVGTGFGYLRSDGIQVIPIGSLCP
jgi:predicted AAA+ superfamily ATPase